MGGGGEYRPLQEEHISLSVGGGTAKQGLK
jgi:hypothetical protein